MHLDTGDDTLLQRLQNEILEAIATGVPFGTIAQCLCLRAEALAPDAICSIVAVDTAGLLHPIAAPSLPEDYSQGLEGLPIGPTVGSCGTAAFTGNAVEVTDIMTDPLWAPYRRFPQELGLMACWSSPIKARDGRVLATFAFYYRSKRGPSAIERLIVKTCVHLCAIALENDEARQRNHQLANFDHLTGLPNRRCFNDVLGARLEGKRPSFGLLLVDIDHLKAINDTMGHLVGDAVIEEVALRLDQAAMSTSAYRLGGDEFAMLVDNCPDHATLATVAAFVQGSMTRPLECDGNRIVPKVTIGGVVWGVDGTGAGVLRQNADFALYHAKETSRGAYCPFDPGLRTSITRRIQTIKDVDQALAEDRILTYYQPIVNLRTGEIIGLEALARMRMPDGSIISAGAFQAALSDPKVAFDLTERMMTTVAGDVRHWIDIGVPFQHVGINFSAADFSREGIEARIASAFEAKGVALKHVILEITETVHMSGLGNTIAKSVKRLREKGLLVALDDFGTGFASLTHLLSFPVDIVKIDKTFIDNLLTDRPSEVIVGSLIDLAGKLNMKIVAEGIESTKQQARLIELGCLLGQGYCFARPADAATTTRLLQLFAQGLRGAGGSDGPAIVDPLFQRRAG